MESFSYADAIAQIDSLCEKLSARVFPSDNTCLASYSQVLADVERLRMSESVLRHDEDLVVTESTAKVVAVLQKLQKHQRIAYMLKLHAKCAKRIKALESKLACRR